MNRYSVQNRINARRKKAIARKKRNRSIFIALLIFTFIFSAFISTGATATKISDTETIHISSGDTLWDIASSCNTNGDDIRDIMDDIIKLNNMKTAQLNIGDKLLVPVY